MNNIKLFFAFSRNDVDLLRHYISLFFIQSAGKKVRHSGGGEHSRDRSGDQDKAGSSKAPQPKFRIPKGDKPREGKKH